MSNISGKEAVRIFQAFGYILDHQTGSHMILYHEIKPTLSIPNHKELAMETIWENLTKKEEKLESPAWHGPILKAREEALLKGEVSISDWSEAKERIK